MKRTRRATRLSFHTEQLETRALLAADVFISEFSADNDSVLRDGDREYPDWIELHNAGDELADLSGWSLTDQRSDLTKWSFPTGSIAPGEFLIVFASGKGVEDSDGNLHTSFRLAKSGDYLGLVGPDGVTIHSEFAPEYPEQLTDISYGVRMDDLTVLDRTEYGFFNSPTPGARNAVAFDLGPLVSDVTHAPAEPLVSEPLLVSAKVEKTFQDVSSVELIYRVMYADEISLVMTDDGQGVDAVAGDGIFSAQIPANIASPGEMIRYYISATDAQANEMRSPRITDTTGTDRSPEYYGTITQDPTLESNLPIFHWFAERTSRARTRAGTRVSVYYDGEFYDNVFARQRGGATNGSSQKFNFNDDQPFYINEKLGRVAEINLNAQGSDPIYVRQPMAYQTYTLAGNESSESFFMLMRDNATRDRVGIYIEQVDEDFLERHGLDPEGALYKFVQRSNLNPVFSDITTGIEKKTRLDEGFDDVAEIVEGLTAATQAERAISVFDQFNLAQLLNYLALRSITMDADDVRKNFYLYRDTNGTGQWSIFPWDKDWTFGITGDGGQFLQHPFFGDEAHRKDNALQWNRLYDAVFNDPVLSKMYLRRLRTVMDEVLQPPGTQDGILEQLADDIAATADGEISGNVSSIKSFLRARRDTLYNDHVVAPGTGEIRDLVPEFTESQYFIPTNNDLGQTWTGLEDPTNIADWQTGQTGIGFHDRFAELVNTQANPFDSCGTCTSIYVRIPFAVDDASAVSAMTLQMKYDDGFIAYLNGQEVARARVEDNISFDMDADSHSNREALEFENFMISDHVDQLRDGRNVLAIQIVNSIPTSNDLLVLPRLVDGVISDSAAAGIPLAQVGNPQITFGAVEHNPAGGQDQEFIELRNDNNVAVDISGWRIEGGIHHTFYPGTVIPAGRALYLTPNAIAFRQRTEGPTGGQGLFVQGNYNGHLSNFGETLSLVARDGTVLDTFTTPVSPSDVQLYLRVSEVHYNPAGDTDATEFIELVNISDNQALDLTGVQIADGLQQPFEISQGTMLPAGQRLVVAWNRDALLAANPALSGDLVIGGYVGRLSNSGESIKINDANGSTVVDFSYDDNSLWPQAADGAGASLTLIDVSTPVEELSKSYRWRGSFEFGGSPGTAGAERPVVTVNEVTSNTDNQPDAIELYNGSTTSWDISGWFLSDASANLKKFQIPANTVLPAGGYVVFSEAQFNSNAASDPFALDGDDGDDVWLTAPVGASVGFVDDVHFGGSRATESFSRQPNGTGWLVPSSPSLGETNSEPRVPQIVISEVHYHPVAAPTEALQILPNLDDNDLEFIELHNPNVDAVDLTNWQIRGGVDLDFPAGLILGGQQTLTVLSFNPTNPRNADRLAAFRKTYAIDESVQLVGGYAGGLSNSQDRVRLEAAGPIVDGAPLHYTEDLLIYDDAAPWPTAADGQGSSLVRKSLTTAALAAADWRSQSPTPGTVDLVDVDINGDGVITPSDIDAVCARVSQSDPSVDFNDDRVTNLDDVTFYVEELLGTTAGDANLDGVFDSTDLVAVFRQGEYEDGITANSTWADGDWNCDLEFGTGDLVLAFRRGSYISAARTQATPVDSLFAAALVSDPANNDLEMVTREEQTEPRQPKQRTVLDEPVLINKLFDESNGRLTDVEIDQAFASLDDDAGARQGDQSRSTPYSGKAL